MAYEFGILRLDVSPEADAHNSSWLGPQTLGIEVTSVPLAVRCGLGNIDPQHSGQMNSSAIEDALTYALPPDGSRLVTIRPDKDSLGAMAVLLIRLFGMESKLDKMLISWTGALDRHGFREARSLLPDLAEQFPNSEATDALNVIARHKSWRSTEERVRDTARILTGQMSRLEMQRIASLYKRSHESFEVEMYGKIAVIEAEGKYQEARNWGNSRYDVALIHDPKYETDEGSCPRWSIVRRSPAFDLAKFTMLVNATEAARRNLLLEDLHHKGFSWGGNANITSSPAGKGRSSVLRKEEVIEAALACAGS